MYTLSLLKTIGANNRPARPPFGGLVSTANTTVSAPSPPSRPQAKQRCVSISGSENQRGVRICGGGESAPAGVQRAAPSGAVRIGRLPGEGCPPHRRGAAIPCGVQAPQRSPLPGFCSAGTGTSAQAKLQAARLLGSGTTSQKHAP